MTLVIIVIIRQFAIASLKILEIVLEALIDQQFMNTMMISN